MVLSCLCRCSITACRLYIARKGVDCDAQFRSKLNCSGGAPGWEQKIFLFFSKTLLVRCFTSSPLLDNAHYLASEETFVSLQKFPDRANKHCLFGDYTSEVTQCFLSYASSLGNKSPEFNICTMTFLPQTSATENLLPTVSINNMSFKWYWSPSDAPSPPTEIVGTYFAGKTLWVMQT